MKNPLLSATTGSAGCGSTKEQNALPAAGLIKNSAEKGRLFHGADDHSQAGLTPSLTLISWKSYLQKL